MLTHLGRLAAVAHQIYTRQDYHILMVHTLLVLVDSLAEMFGMC